MDTSELDFEAMESQYNPQTRIEPDFKFIYKKKPKTVNLCPYCRALVGAVITLPFLYLWRLFPHKEKKSWNREESMKRMNRNSLILRGAISLINWSLAAKYLLAGDYILAAIQISVAIFVIGGHWFIPPMLKWMIKHWPKITWKRKTKPKKIKKPHKESQLAKKIHEKHDLICPPIFFVDVQEPEALR